MIHLRMVVPPALAERVLAALERKASSSTSSTFPARRAGRAATRSCTVGWRWHADR
jgi:hypothetical protein